MTRAAPGHTPVDRFFEFSLLGLLASGYLAVAGSGSLDWPTAVMAGVALIARGLVVAGILRLQLSPVLVASATIAYMGFVPIDYAFLSKSFLPATVHLVFFIAIVKLLTATTNRDYFFLKTIAFLELLAACVLSASINFSFFLALFLLLAVATFASSEMRRSAQQVVPARVPRSALTWRLGGLTAALSCSILLLTAALFFLLPRTARAAFQHLVPHRYHLAGFSNQVDLGEIGEIKTQNTPVMHVKLDAGVNLPLKWRGMALANFDGKRWFNVPARSETLRPDFRGQVELSGFHRHWNEVSYEVRLSDAAPEGVLFFAGVPHYLRVESPLIRRTLTGDYRVLPGPASQNYYASAYIAPYRNRTAAPDSDEEAPFLTEEARARYLRLPSMDVRVWKLARDLTGVTTNPEIRARALERGLRTRYTYTLELPSRESADPLANFLFVRRKGHCEYFASAMAVMLRTLGIPSRVVTGFQGGVFNPVNGWQLIRASDAHSWVEAWLPATGWTAFDPTPPDPNPPHVSFWSKIGFYTDAADIFWQDWVLNYNLDRQLLLAARMQESGHGVRMSWVDELAGSSNHWRASAWTFPAGFGAAGLSAVVFFFLALRQMPALRNWLRNRGRVRKVRRGEAEPGDATLLYERMLKVLRKRGMERPAWMTPNEFAQGLPRSPAATIVEDLTRAYNDLRFGGNAEAAQRMAGLLHDLEATTL